MPTNHYDLIVLGDDFAGLVAATLCARRGLRVLLATTSRAASSYQVGPYRLPIEPMPLVGLGGPGMRRVLDELHFHHLLKRKLRASQPAFQMVGPDVRISVDPDDAVLGRELDREWPGAARVEGGISPAGAAVLAACDRAAQIASLLDPVFSMDIAVPPTGFWERREIGRTADRLLDDSAAWDALLESDLARAFFSLPAAFGSNSDPTQLGGVTRARAFSEWRQGIARLSGDWEALRAIFLDKFTSHNGEVRAVEPQSLSSSWGKVTGVVLEKGEELGATHLLAAMPVDDLARLCDRKLAKRLAEVGEGMQAGAYRYTLNLVLDGIGVPEGMGSSVLMVADPGRPLQADNAIALFVDQQDAEARVAVTVQAICPAPASGVPADLDDMLADLRVRLRERLESVMPFYAEHVRLVHSPHESAPAEGLGDDAPGPARELPLRATPDRPAAGGAEAGAVLMTPRPLWRWTGEPLLGVAGLPYLCGVKQLLLASSQTLPGLGLEGEVTAGWCAAKLVCEASGKKKDYLKDEVLTVGRG